MKWLLAIGFVVATSAFKNATVNNKLLPIDYHAFNLGEKLVYNIHYGFIDAGMAIFQVADTMHTVGGKPHFVCEAIGKSYGWWDNFYKVRDFYLSYVDSQSLYPSVYSRNISEGDYKSLESYYFNRKKQLAIGQHDGEESRVKIPLNVHDLVSMIYYMRSFNYGSESIGKEIPLNVFFENEWFESSMEIVGEEEIKTNLGRFNCLKIVPKLVEGRVFSGQNSMTVYVTADKNHIPVRIESGIFVGSIKVDLEEYENLKFPLSSFIED
ncbi:MAG: DUF3108 domain-containing protein [Bacteroidetes bacterium]|nr:DUF3108 domain-containing protein [Bacteroidota bacterium]